MTGIIILGHGSRSEEANKALIDIAAMVKSQVNQENVEAAYLQFCKPDLKDSVANMAAKGVTKVIVMPLFLFKGIHIQEDVPGELAELRAQYEGKMEIAFAGHLGIDPRIAEIAVDRIKEVS